MSRHHRRLQRRARGHVERLFGEGVGPANDCGAEHRNRRVLVEMTTLIASALGRHDGVLDLRELLLLLGELLVSLGDEAPLVQAVLFHIAALGNLVSELLLQITDLALPLDRLAKIQLLIRQKAFLHIEVSHESVKLGYAARKLLLQRARWLLSSLDALRGVVVQVLARGHVDGVRVRALRDGRQARADAERGELEPRLVELPLRVPALPLLLRQPIHQGVLLLLHRIDLRVPVGHLLVAHHTALLLRP
mmetsp:Transcript_62857/g.192263  ORF Transcript_62857/g.192263 Transcript_62857/m.192263 type:complete len:249 (-) Transcript_62857:446-1192(-)